MTVYHGSLYEIREPNVAKSKPYVDFGPAFYVTSFQSQAERWALRKANRSGNVHRAYVNQYDLDLDALTQYKVLRFNNANEEWLDFVCSCRKGVNVYESWDAVIGPVADDDVFKSVNKYFKGEWTKEETLQKLSFLHQSDQIAILNQDCLTTVLKFKASYNPPGDIVK
jgi:hypothetical protein